MGQVSLNIYNLASACCFSVQCSAPPPVTASGDSCGLLESHERSVWKHPCPPLWFQFPQKASRTLLILPFLEKVSLTASACLTSTAPPSPPGASLPAAAPPIIGSYIRSFPTCRHPSPHSLASSGGLALGAVSPCSLPLCFLYPDLREIALLCMWNDSPLILATLCSSHLLMSSSSGFSLFPRAESGFFLRTQAQNQA